ARALGISIQSRSSLLPGGRSLKAHEPLPVMLRNFVVIPANFLAVSLLHLLQASQHSFGDDTSRLPLFAVWPRGSCQAEQTDQGRQRNALQYKRHDNNIEGKKEDQIAPWERAAVSNHHRQRKGGGEGDHPPHSSPADDENRPRRGPRLVLTEEPRAQKPGEVSAGVIPKKAQQDQ